MSFEKVKKWSLKLRGDGGKGERIPRKDSRDGGKKATRSNGD
jgi:hypothetical protein